MWTDGFIGTIENSFAGSHWRLGVSVRLYLTSICEVEVSLHRVSPVVAKPRNAQPRRDACPRTPAAPPGITFEKLRFPSQARAKCGVLFTHFAGPSTIASSLLGRGGRGFECASFAPRAGQLNEEKTAAAAKATAKLVKPLAKFLCPRDSVVRFRGRGAFCVSIRRDRALARKRRKATDSQICGAHRLASPEVRPAEGPDESPHRCGWRPRAQRVLDGGGQIPSQDGGRPDGATKRGPFPLFVTFGRRTGVLICAPRDRKELRARAPFAGVGKSLYKVLRKTCYHVPGDPASIKSPGNGGQHTPFGEFANTQDSDWEPFRANCTREELKSRARADLMNNLEERALTLD